MTTPHSHIPYGPDGSGCYSDSVKGCYDVIGTSTPIVLEALAKIPYSKDDGTFTICDYGTADGGTSMPLLMDCVKWIKDQYGNDQEISVVYEDQPVNDFKSLFMRIQGLIPGPPSYYQKYPGVYVTACGTSFYSQCVPNGTVHLGFSATSMHWLSKRPGPLDNAMHHTLSKNAVQKKMFADQAARDWETILINRAKEMRIGAQLVIVVFNVDEDGYHFGAGGPYAKEGLYEQMMECWTEMAMEGKITQEERQNLQINNYYRTEEEFRSPFTPNSPVYEAGLRLLTIESKKIRCPYHQKWMEEGIKDDPEAARAHAKWFVPTTRVWSNSSFLSALSNDRLGSEKAKIVDEFFLKYEDRVAAAPHDHACDYIHAYMHIEKISAV